MAVASEPKREASVLIACRDRALETALSEQLARHAIEVRRINPDAELMDPKALRGARVVVLQLAEYDALATILALRSISEVPLVAIVDAQRTVDPVDVLESGADDFITNPCPPRDVAAKVRAWLRRIDAEPNTGLRKHYGELELDFDAREVRKNGELIAVPPREFDLLAFVAQRPRRAFSRHELLEQVWSASDHWLGPATVTEHVRRLRHRIEDEPARPRLVQTVRGVGYRFEPTA